VRYLFVLVVLASLAVAVLLVDASNPEPAVEVESSYAPSPLWYERPTTTTVPPTTTVAPTTTTTTAPVAVVARSAPTYHGSIPDLIRSVFSRFGAVVAEQAVRVSHCETGGTFDPGATGRQGEVGIFQLHPKYQSGRAAKFGYSMADLYDPVKNAEVAADLYAESGWRPWTCRSAV
jgi:glucose/arabinose dehydrogenase